MSTAIPVGLPRFSTRPRGFGVLAVVFGLLAVAGPAAADAPYRLSIGDKVRVRVVQWNPVDATMQEWTAIDGDYVVGPSGAIAFPFIGETPGAGKTTAELSSALSAELHQTLALVNAPDVTTEVSDFAPVYVTGDVQTPGKYAFAPGLDVMKTVSLAGGERRSPDADTRTDRDLITLQGAEDVFNDQHTRLLITRARLDAELAGQKDFALPAGLPDDTRTTGLMAVEQSVLTADEQQVSSQLDALAAQSTTLDSELSVLRQKRDATTRELQAAQDQLDKVQSLAKNGLAINDRVNAAMTAAEDLESRGLDIDNAVLQAQQGLSQAKKENVQIVGKHSADLTTQRQQVDQQIAELELKIATQKQLITEAIAYGGDPRAQEGLDAAYSYTIIRGRQQVPATTTSEVQPGDVIVAKVQLPN